MIPEAGQADFDGMGQKAVVGIEKYKALADTVPQSGVACGGQPLVFLPEIVHAGVTSYDRGGVVSRAIVHNHNLKVGIGLGQYALDRLPQEMGLLVARDHHRHKRLVRIVDIFAPAASRPDYPDWDAALIF
jgi:hypothetical protein